MKTKLKIGIFAVACFFLLCSVVAICIGNLSNGKAKDDIYIKNSTEKYKEAKEEIPAQEVSVPNSKTEKYILKYIKEDSAVYLITKKEDGTEIFSLVESIKPFYLTKEDLDSLTKGIELSSKEDMFILIEDYSS